MSELVFEKEDLPKGWIRTKLGNCVQILDNERIPINSNERKNRQGGIPYYGATGQVGFIDDYIFNDELVLLGEDGVPFLENFKNKAYIINGKSWVNNHAHVLQGIQNLLLNNYLCHFLNVVDYHEYVSGTTRLKLNQYSMKQIKIILPPLPEQKRIISRIESIFAQIDAAGKNLQQIMMLVKICRQSMLKHAFEGKLVPQDPNDEPAEMLLKRIHKDSEIVFEKDGLPKGWIAVKINDACELMGGGTPSRIKSEYFNGDIIWLTPTEILKNNIVRISNSKEKITELGLQKSSAKLIPENSVLLTSRASIGYVAIAGAQVTTNQGFASFICSKMINNYFLAYWLWKNRNVLIENATGTTFKEIPKSVIKQLEIQLPPFPEQKRIVAKIESIFEGIDAVEKNVESALNKLDALKKSTLKQAFEGKLVPQDPNDEPAEILLEKIKLEKEQLIQTQERRKKIVK